MQSMLHEAACVQFTPFLHALSVLQAMSQRYPAGQVTAPLVQFVIWQLIVHVFCCVLHEVHWPGQPVPASPRGASPRGASIVLPLTTQ